MIEASPLEQRKLLNLQDCDTKIQQILHKILALDTDPKIVEVKNLCEMQRKALAVLEIKVSDIEREQRRFELDLEQIVARIVRTKEHLDLSVSSKDTQGLEKELLSLDKRKLEIEDSLFVFMETLENLAKEAFDLKVNLEKQEQFFLSLDEQRQGQLSVLLEEEKQQKETRFVLASGLDAGLLALYEKVREKNGGVGVAQLLYKRCLGCQLELSPADLDFIKNSSLETIVRCEQCGRILVRVEETVG